MDITKYLIVLGFIFSIGLAKEIRADIKTFSDENHQEVSHNREPGSLEDRPKRVQKSVDITRVKETVDTCKLTVDADSKDTFSTAILKNKYNFVYLKLDFFNFELNAASDVINKNDWVWTYKGENGAYQYLYLSEDFGYLSLGLLWTQTRLEPIKIGMYQTGNCSTLELGSKNLTANYLIGNALGEMTSEIASQDDLYNASYWCYNQRVGLYSDFVIFLCKHAICSIQTFEFNCCRYKTSLNGKNRTIECGQDHYEFGKLWWLLPLIIGEICFAFYPLLLTSIGKSLNRLIKLKLRKGETLPSRALNTFARQRSETSETERVSLVDSETYIPLKNSSPITFLSVVSSPLNRCYRDRPLLRRLSRICIILIPMVISTIRVSLDYAYDKELVTEAVRKGAYLGFSSIIAGTELANKEFLFIIGGPIVALSVYVIFGCILIVWPSDLEQFLENGLPDYSGKYIILVRMPLKLKEKLSGFGIRNHLGWKRLHNIFLAQSFMLLYWKFWWQSIRFFYNRWFNIIDLVFATKFTFVFACVLYIFILPIYVLFCLVELMLSVIYFAFPVVNCFWIAITAAFVEFFNLFENRGLLLKIIRNIFVIPLLVLFCITWYMFCIIFFDGFWFLSKIVMFTYSGVMAYPKVSYGYLILAFMSVYYLMESVHSFGKTYRQLLKISIGCCEKFKSRSVIDSDFEDTETEVILSRKGVNRELFMKIVDNCQPRRNQVMITLLKFSSVLTVITVSVELLKTFDKFQELSVVSHVFTVLFICALPKIFRSMCMQGYEYKQRKRLKLKVYRVISQFLQSRRSLNNDFEEEDLQISRGNYESFGGENSDVE